ncbi:MAG TPA: DUF711 family protein [Candidatus Dormibacteraeota bacterium]|nr:DUF711 family protein [Candidatus Dormibacteraeota bacterium]
MRIRSVLNFAIAVAFFALFSSSPLLAQQKPAAPSPTRPKIRTITAFLNLDRTQYQQQITDALQMLRRAKTIFESRGYEVQTIRIATQPFPEYTKGLTPQQTIAFFKDLDALAEKEKFAPGIGPAMLNAGDPDSQADLLADILANTKHIRGSIVIAGDDGVRWRAIGAAARAIKKLEDTTEHSQGNFNLGAIADVPPLSPFFTAAYVDGFGHQFAIGLESANVVAEAFRGATDVDAAKQKLTSMLASEAIEIERHANRIDMETGWAYVGIDLSPAPLKDVSIGAAIENLIAQPFGSAGTLTAAATITAAVKAVPVKQTGYNGLMLPILEDSRLAERWSQGRVSLEGLLSYSAVCGTGLDTIPLPGDISTDQLTLILADVATLAVKWHKPLSARLLPVKGKIAGDTSEFNDPFLVNAVIQPFEPR